MMAERWAPPFLEQAEILQRIAVDHQQVGIGAGLDDAELAFLADDLGARSWSPSG